MSLLRTVKGGDAYVTGADYLIVGAITVFAPAVLGGIAALLLDLLAAVTSSVHILGVAIAFLAGQMMAPVFTLFAVPVALLIGRFALRLGWAGWGMALLVPMTIIAAGMYAYAHSGTGYQPIVYVDPARIFMLSGGLHGLVMWLALRWRRPEALAAR